MDERERAGTPDGEAEYERLRARSTELEQEIGSARGELAAKRALVERGGRARAGPGRRALGDFAHVIAGVIFLLAVLLAGWVSALL